MFPSRTAAAIAVSWLASTALAGDTTNTQFYSTPTVNPTGVRASTYSGCYATSVPMIDHGPHLYQTSGNCQRICYTLQNNVMGLGNGTDCWCGDMLPPVNAKVSDDQCNTPCAGFGTDKCGGATVWSVFLTGFTLNQVQNYDPKAASSSTMSASPSSSSSSSNSGKKSSSAVGIVVGVIVGVVIVGALAGAGFIMLRRRQRRELDDIKKQTEAPPFVGGGKVDQARPQMWAPDSRLDNDAAGRRISNGSIADNQDFSRRILQVRNPDGF